LPSGELRLKNMFDAAINKMRFDGMLHAILEKYKAVDL